MIFVDSNVLLDLVDQGDWHEWSLEKVERLGASDGLAVNAIVVAEVAPAFPTLASLTHWLEQLDIDILELDLPMAFAAGVAFRAYRRRYKERDALLSDFLIGAHARELEASLVTRDSRIYRRYFPELALITPETDNG